MALCVLGQEPFFRDRREAGMRLAEALVDYAGSNPLVLGVPRGGVVVAAEVASGLGADLDVVLARKLGAPSNPELAVGALGETGEPVLNPRVVEAFRLSEEDIRRSAREVAAEIERRARLYRGARGSNDPRGRTVIIVDDGTATGATARAAVETMRGSGPREIVVAMPVGPPEVFEDLAEIADEVVALAAPAYFSAVGVFYSRFDQTTDEEVIEILARFAARGRPGSSAA